MTGTQLKISGEGIDILGDYRPIANRAAAEDYPLVVAIHGGSYTHTYFDIEGASLLDRASSLGIPIAAIDRPCYGRSGKLEPEQATIQRGAEVVNAALQNLWDKHAGKARGIFLIGHSIGGAVAILIASLASAGRSWESRHRVSECALRTQLPSSGNPSRRFLSFRFRPSSRTC